MSIPEGDAETTHLEDHLLTASSANDSAIAVGSGTSGGQRSSSTEEMEVIQRIDDLDHSMMAASQANPTNQPQQTTQKLSSNRGG